MRSGRVLCGVAKHLSMFRDCNGVTGELLIVNTRKSNIKLFFAALLVSIVCIQCSSHTQLRPAPMPEYTSMRIKNFGNLPSNSVYRLGVDDVIEIKFFNNDQYDQISTVRPDGRISMSILDEIFVVGMTPLQLDSIITRVYSKYIQNPKITVFVREFGAKQVFLLGQVKTPGVYEISRNMTLLHAITTAGGLLDGAEPSSVMLLRRKNQVTVTAFKIDVTPFLKPPKYPVQHVNPVMQPMDIVYVPKSYIANTSQFLSQIYDLLLPPVDMYLRALWYTELIRR